MSVNADEDLSRVTVISPIRRIDLALPTSVTLADVLPTIVSMSGFPTPHRLDIAHAWVLQRFGADPLDPNALVATLDLRDGEILHLRRREAALPDAAFDDVADAVASATARRPTWGVRHTRIMAALTLALALVGVPVISLRRLWLQALVGQPAPLGWHVAIVVAAAVACLLCLVFGSLLTRVRRDLFLGLVLSWIGVALSLVVGFWLLGPVARLSQRHLADMALAATAAALAALAGGRQRPAFLAATLTAALLAGPTALMVTFPGGTHEIAATALAILIACLPAVPAFAQRAGGLAIDDLDAASDTAVPGDIVRRAIRSDRIQAATMWSLAVSIVLLAATELAQSRLRDVIYVWLIALLVLLQARLYRGLHARLALLAAGAALVLLTVERLADQFNGPVVPVLLVMGVAAAAAVILAILVRANQATPARAATPSGLLEHILDDLEWTVALCLVPTLVWVLGLNTLIASLAR